LNSRYGSLIDLSLYMVVMDELELTSYTTFIASWTVEQRIPRTLILSAPSLLSVSSEASFKFACALNTSQFNGVDLIPKKGNAWFNSTPPPFAREDDDENDDIDNEKDDDDGGGGSGDDEDERLSEADDDDDHNADNADEEEDDDESGDDGSSGSEGGSGHNIDRGHGDATDDPCTCLQSPSSSSSASEECDCMCTFEYQLDSFAGWLPTSNPVTLWHVPEGHHSLQVRSVRVDTGMVDPHPVTFHWSIELEMPELTFISTPQSPLHDTAANFKFSSNKPVDSSSYYMLLINKTDDEYRDGGSWENIEVSKHDGSFSLLLTKNGHYVVYFAMQDERSGQWDVAASSGHHLMHEITLDRSRPETFVLSSPVTPSQTMTPVFFITSNHPDANFDYCVDRSFNRHYDNNEEADEEEPLEGGGDSRDGCWYDVNSDFINIDGMVEGSHNLTVRATIKEWSETSSTYSIMKDKVPSIVGWEVDADAPDTAFLLSQPAFEASNIEASTHLNSIIFAWGSSEPVKKFSLQLDESSNWIDLELFEDDDVSNSPCLAATPCSLMVSSNQRKLSHLKTSSPSSSHDKRSMMVDNVDLPITWYYSSSIGGEDLETLDVLTLVVNNFPDGPHKISVRSVDKANNFDASPALVNFVVDSSLKPGVPASPCAVNAQASDGSAIVSWLPLHDDGLDQDNEMAYFTVVGTTSFTGSPMYSYHFVKGKAASTSTNGLSNAVAPLSIDKNGRYFTRVENVQNKNMYKFSVTARNSAGMTSAMSWFSDWVTPFDPSDPCSRVDCNDDPAELVQGGTCFLLRNNDGDLGGACICRPGFTGSDCRNTVSTAASTASSSSTNDMTTTIRPHPHLLLFLHLPGL
jgi:hypothetical protein